MKTPFIRIQADKTVTVIDGAQLDTLQEAVGGYITSVRPHNGSIPSNTVCYANDEGILLGMVHNPLASSITGVQLYGPVIIRATKAVQAKCPTLFNVTYADLLD